MDNIHPARGQFRPQRPHGQVGLPGQPRQKPIPDRTRKDRAAMSPDLAGSLPATRTLPLTDPNRPAAPRTV